MEEPFLYRRIADQFRLEILAGHLKPGDRLPSIREQTRQWGCTQGTVQRAYQELAQQGLVVSRTGKGTLVAGHIDPLLMQGQGPLRRASLVHKADVFLLEALTAGFELDEIRQAVDLALDRWRALQARSIAPIDTILRFSGSNDPAVSWLAARMPEIVPGTELQINFTGSLGGLMALADGRADLAGAHLWDTETQLYNRPFISKLFPNRKMALVRLADRRLGWITAPGNPHQIKRLADIALPGLRFVNRQSGSGTRVWLDGALQAAGIERELIGGYGDEKSTHAEVARAIAEGQADLGLGLESAAAAFQLEFVFLVRESYDLVMAADDLERAPLRTLVEWLSTDLAHAQLGSLVGYDTHATGSIQHIG
jgi:molybdate-binding protein/DNA-binding transcriptional regulator YhcF (GntR family)